MNVNVYDTRAHTVGVSIPVITKPPSPSCSTESEPILGGANFEFDSTYYSPYRLPSEDDDEAPLSKQHLQSLHDKLDKLLASPSTYFDVVLKAFLDTDIQQYTSSIDKSTDAVKASTLSCQKATLEVTKVVQESKIFLDSFKRHEDSNAAKVNASIDNLSKSLQEENIKLDKVRSKLKDDHNSLLSLFNSRLKRL